MTDSFRARLENIINYVFREGVILNPKVKDEAVSQILKEIEGLVPKEQDDESGSVIWRSGINWCRQSILNKLKEA